MNIDDINTHLEKIEIPKNMIILGCPFCGSENIIAFSDTLFNDEKDIGFYCCGCETLFETKFDGIKDAINYCWNNRSG